MENWNEVRKYALVSANHLIFDKELAKDIAQDALCKFIEKGMQPTDLCKKFIFGGVKFAFQAYYQNFDSVYHKGERTSIQKFEPMVNDAVSTPDYDKSIDMKDLFESMRPRDSYSTIRQAIKRGMSAKAIAAKYKVSKNTVARVRDGKAKPTLAATCMNLLLDGFNAVEIAEITGKATTQISGILQYAKRPFLSSFQAAA